MQPLLIGSYVRRTWLALDQSRRQRFLSQEGTVVSDPYEDQFHVFPGQRDDDAPEPVCAWGAEASERADQLLRIVALAVRANGGQLTLESPTDIGPYHLVTAFHQDPFGVGRDYVQMVLHEGEPVGCRRCLTQSIAGPLVDEARP